MSTTADSPAGAAAPASTAPGHAAALELHRSLARDCNLLAGAESRPARKAALVKIASTLEPWVARARGKVAVAAAPAPKPKLIFSAKAAAAAAAAAPQVAEPSAAPANAPLKPAAPLTPDQIEAVGALDQLLYLPGASGSHTLLALLVQRIGDELESLRAQTLTLFIESAHSNAQPAQDRLLGALGSAPSVASLLPVLLPVIHSRLSPSAASLSAASSFAATSMPSSSSSASPATIQSGIAIPAGASSLAALSMGSTGPQVSLSGAHMEPSEELRLRLLQLLVKLVECEQQRAVNAAAAAGGAVSGADPSLRLVYAHLDKLVAVALKTVTDPFPDLKKESCHLITMLSAMLAREGAPVTGVARADAGNALQKALLPNLKHQHSQVRVQALQAFGAVVRHLCGESLSSGTIDALPLLSSLLFDRTPRVREVLIQEVVSWIQGLPHLLPVYQSKLIALLLSLTADEVPSIAVAAVQAINGLGETVAAASAAAAARSEDHPMQSDSGSGGTFLTAVDSSSLSDAAASSASPWPSAPLSAPFLSRPPASARALIRAHASELLSAFVADLSDWTQTKRLRSAGALKSLLLYLGGEGIVPHLVPLLQALIKAIRDEASAVHSLVAECAEIVGVLVTDSSVWMEWILPELEKQADTNYRTSLLLVLLNMVRGMPILMQTGAASAATQPLDAQAQSANDARIARVFPQLLNTLSHPDLCCADDAALRLQLHRIISCVLSRIPRSCGGSKAFAEKIFHMLVQLDTKSGTAATTAAPAVGAASASAPPASTEEERHILTALELLARCEMQYGDLKVEMPASASGSAAATASASSASTPSAAASASNATSIALLQAVYAAHFLPELRLLLGADLVASPSSAADLLPAGWGSGKDVAHFTCLTFFQLLERAASLSALGSRQVAGGAADASVPPSAAASLLETHLPLLLPVLVHSARPANDPAVRSLSLSFVYKMSLLHDGALLRGVDGDLLRALVADVLVPNCVWRVGRVAASLRLHALTVMHAMFAHHLLSPALVLQLCPALLPILQSNLDDDEARLRMLVLLLLQMLLQLLPPHSLRLEDDSLTALHRDLLKRLDDAHDDIRLQVVATFSLLFHRAFPPAAVYDKTDSYFRYILQCFFVYLDDANPKLVDACFTFLQSAIAYNTPVFVQETEAARKRQTTGRYCEQLLAMAQQAQA